MSQNLGRSAGMSPEAFVYERRSSTISSPVPASTSGYILLEWVKPNEWHHFLLYAIGSDQHAESYYSWVVDGVELPISGPARIGTPESPYFFFEPIRVSGTVKLYVSNNGARDYPNSGDLPDDEYPYECVIIGRYE